MIPDATGSAQKSNFWSHKSAARCWKRHVLRGTEQPTESIPSSGSLQIPREIGGVSTGSYCSKIKCTPPAVTRHHLGNGYSVIAHRIVFSGYYAAHLVKMESSDLAARTVHYPAVNVWQYRELLRIRAPPFCRGATDALLVRRVPGTTIRVVHGCEDVQASAFLQ